MTVGIHMTWYVRVILMKAVHKLTIRKIKHTFQMEIGVISRLWTENSPTRLLRCYCTPWNVGRTMKAVVSLVASGNFLQIPANQNEQYILLSVL